MPPTKRYKVGYRPEQAPDKSKPWCVYNVDTGDINGRWHASEADAKKQLRAIYASLGGSKMKNNNMNEINHLLDLKQFTETGRARWIGDTNQMWIQQYPFASWSHPLFTDTHIDAEAAKALKASFDAKTYNGKYLANYEHGFDKAKGGKASGEIQELKVIEEPRGIFTQPGLWARVEFSDNAKKEIDDGEWHYWSSSHYDTWTDPQNEKHDMVFVGGTLTNDPYVKGMVPLNFSEVGISEAEAQAHADQLILENDDVDMELVKARSDALREGVVINFGMTVDEIRDAIARKPLNNEGGEMDGNELETKLRAALKLGDDVDIVEHVTGMDTELQPLRDALKESEKTKAFSESWPEEAAELKRLREQADEDQAKHFSQSFAKARFQKNVKKEDSDEVEAEDTTVGLTALSLDKVHEFAKSFSAHTATPAGFKEVLDTILGPGGTVDYGTKGSSREDDADLKEFDEKRAASGSPKEVRKIFFSKVKEIELKDEIPFTAALEQAAKTYPQLAEAYRTNMPGKGA